MKLKTSAENCTFVRLSNVTRILYLIVIVTVLDFCFGFESWKISFGKLVAQESTIHEKFSSYLPKTHSHIFLLFRVRHIKVCTVHIFKGIAA